MNAAGGLSESYPAVAGAVPVARDALARFAYAAGADDDQADSVRLAASEAMTNVVRHAYAGEPGTMHVTAALTPGELWVMVADEGSGLRAGNQTPGLGKGLALIACVTDYFAVVRRPEGGTEVRMRFALDSARRQGSGDSHRDQRRGLFCTANAPA